MKRRTWPVCVLLAWAFACPEPRAATITASTEIDALPARAAFDRDRATRWSSEASDAHWIQVDFDEEKTLVGLRLLWEVAFASAYDVLVSSDGIEWSKVFATDTADGGTDEVYFSPVRARYLKIVCRRRGTNWGYSLFEVIPKTAGEPWGEGEPGGFFDLGGRTTVFIPSSWSNEQPFLRLADFHDGFGLTINGAEVMRTDSDPGRIVIPVADKLAYGSENSIHISVREGGATGRVLLAGSEALWKQGRDDFRARYPKEYFPFVAQHEPEGWYPHWLTGRLGFWTVAGVDGDFKESLLAEDGALEPYKSFSIAPFLYFKGVLLTREDADVRQDLEQGALPIPSVTWLLSNVTFRITACAGGEPGASTTYMRYRVENTSGAAITGRLFLVMRPFEINPPWQWGGVTRIHEVDRNNRYVSVNEFRLFPLTPVSAYGAAEGAAGDALEFVSRGVVPPRPRVQDAEGFASAALAYDLALEPGQARDVYLAIPLHRDSPVAEGEREAGQIFAAAGAAWHARLARMPFVVPDATISNALRASLAHILVNRDGPAIQPGSRSYEASWMRDGAMTSAALLRMGYSEEARAFLEWYSKYLYDDGRVPAIVIIGRNEVNPVREYDSQGEFVHAFADYYRYTRDRKFLEAGWPLIRRSLVYLDALREEENRPELKESESDRRYFGILPRSVSHEGYYPEPGNHSYWDDFWGLRGWRDAEFIARLLGKGEDQDWIRREFDELQQGVADSVREAMRFHRIDVIPGCAELGDFDPTSTAIAVLLGVDDVLPVDGLKRTFQRYLADVSRRKEAGWTGSFSPYEFRNVEALVRRGQAADALELLAYLMTFRRPEGWNQWPEAVYVPERTPGYIGDMPHTWAASGFINAVRTCLLFEEQNTLVVGAGVPLAWIDAGEAGVRDAPTYWGNLSYSVRREGDRIVFELGGDAAPPDGFIVHPPVGFEGAQARSVTNLPCAIEFTPSSSARP